MVADHVVLQGLESTAAPIDTPMACSSALSIDLTDARTALDRLARAGLIDWTPATRDRSGTVTIAAHWEVTAAGRKRLAEGPE